MNQLSLKNQASINTGLQSRRDETTKTEQIFEEENRLKQKKREKTNVETVMFEPAGEYEDGSTPAVKWSKSVVNKYSREATRTAGQQASNPLMIKSDDLRAGQATELKSTTEINMILH